MTRTDVMASSRPDTVPMKRRSSGLRGLLALPVVLLLAFAVMAPATAFGAEETTTGYNQEPNKPTTTTTTTPTTPATTPTTGTSPSKEEEPAATTPKEETSPTSTTSPAKETAKTLPFTGFDLRWSFGIGLLLMAAGFTIVLMQRRREGER
jgi:uncharacterized surface anchored protein